MQPLVIMGFFAIGGLANPPTKTSSTSMSTTAAANPSLVNIYGLEAGVASYDGSIISVINQTTILSLACRTTTTGFNSGKSSCSPPYAFITSAPRSVWASKTVSYRSELLTANISCAYTSTFSQGQPFTSGGCLWQTTGTSAGVDIHASTYHDYVALPTAVVNITGGLDRLVSQSSSASSSAVTASGNAAAGGRISGIGGTAEKGTWAVILVSSAVTGLLAVAL